jgi:transposase
MYLQVRIDDSIDVRLLPIKRFAQTPHRDTDEVRNAIELPWSKGQAEGQIY